MRSILTPDHYAYLKIAEGCDNGCSFCSIPIMRGLQKSRTIDSIMWEAEKLSDKGIKELLVIAQDTTSYGWDLRPKQYLGDLIKELDQLDFEWIRIHYAHPAHLSKKIIQAIADAQNICNYIDMPIQHASDPILKSMRRGLDSSGIKKRIHLLRDAVPNIKIRTTLIVGYPGETEKDFEETIDLINKVGFLNSYSFIFSPRPGTPIDKKEIKNSDQNKEKLKKLQSVLDNFYRTKMQ